ncbi:MAG: dodecin domain-containing protein [Candidatus Thorarchaeota archaeon]|jgi:flavin-binding protein dodecin
MSSPFIINLIAEVITHDVRIENIKIAEYRFRLKLSFKYEKE